MEMYLRVNLLKKKIIYRDAVSRSLRNTGLHNLGFVQASNRVIPRLTKIIRSGITFVSRNLCKPKRDFPWVSMENRLIRSGCCPLFKDRFYKIVKSTL